MEMSVHSILKTSIFVTFLHYLLAREARATRLRFGAQMRGFSQEMFGKSDWLFNDYGINVNYLLIIIIQKLLIISIKNDTNNKYTEKYHLHIRKCFYNMGTLKIIFGIYTRCQQIDFLK